MIRVELQKIKSLDKIRLTFEIEDDAASEEALELFRDAVASLLEMLSPAPPDEPKLRPCFDLLELRRRNVEAIMKGLAQCS